MKTISKTDIAIAVESAQDRFSEPYQSGRLWAYDAIDIESGKVIATRSFPSRKCAHGSLALHRLVCAATLLLSEKPDLQTTLALAYAGEEAMERNSDPVLRLIAALGALGDVRLGA